MIIGGKAAPGGVATRTIFVGEERRGRVVLCWYLCGAILMDYCL